MSQERPLLRTAQRLLAGARSVSRPVSRHLGAVWSLAVREVKIGLEVPIPLHRRLWLWRRGFSSKADVLLDLDDRDPASYLTEYQYQFAHDVNGRWGELTNNKLACHQLLERFDEHRPTTFGLLRRGTVTPIDGPVEASPSLDGGSTDVAPVADRVLSRLRADGSLVLKPVYGYGGDEVHICEWRDGGPIVDGTPQSVERFEAFVEGLDDYLICERIEQAAYAERIFPGATNTIRALTMWDEAADEPFVAAAAHRFGTATSAPVDNWSRGGVAAPIDLETGELGPGAWEVSATRLERGDVHPDTGARIRETRVPNWSDVSDTVLELAASLPQLPYLAWDLVVTDDGGTYVIEVNSDPGLNTIQVHRPILTDPRVSRFFRRHGVV